MNGHFIIPKFLPAIPLFIGLQLKLRDYYFLGISLAWKSSAEKFNVRQFFGVCFSDIVTKPLSFSIKQRPVAAVGVLIDLAVSRAGESSGLGESFTESSDS